MRPNPAATPVTPQTTAKAMLRLRPQLRMLPCEESRLRNAPKLLSKDITPHSPGPPGSAGPTIRSADAAAHWPRCLPGEDTHWGTAVDATSTRAAGSYRV